MKNRVLLPAVAALLALSLAACGGDKEETKQINNDAVDTDVETTVAVTDKASAPEREHSELLPGTHKVPLKEIYVDTPAYNIISRGYTEMYVDGRTKYVSFNCIKDGVANDAKSAFDVVYSKFKNNVANQQIIVGEALDEGEVVAVNGIEAYKVSGIVKGGAVVTTDCYFYGYSFMYDGIPCGIFGVVRDWEQPEEEIESVTAIVDAMMESVRSEQ